MPLPADPPISMLAVYSEFGAPALTPLSALVRGGDYVPDGAGTGQIPIAVPLSLLDFRSAFVPAAVVIDQVTAVGATVGSAFSALQATADVTHPTVTGQVVSADFSIVARFRVDRATTPKLRLAVRASNPVVQGVYRAAHVIYAVPAFDDPVVFVAGSGVLLQDTAGEKQGGWAAISPVPNVGLSEASRVTDALVLTNSAVNGGQYSVTFSFSHSAIAYIGGVFNFGSLFSRSCAGGAVNYALSLMFLDNVTNALVQELPVDIIIATNGTLQSYAVNFTP